MDHGVVWRVEQLKRAGARLKRLGLTVFAMAAIKGTREEKGRGEIETGKVQTMCRDTQTTTVSSDDLAKVMYRLVPYPPTLQIPQPSPACP